jgi:hypothetical protein
MGGFGSGRRSGSGRDTVEACRTIVRISGRNTSSSHEHNIGSPHNKADGNVRLKKFPVHCESWDRPISLYNTLERTDSYFQHVCRTADEQIIARRRPEQIRQRPGKYTMAEMARNWMRLRTLEFSILTPKLSARPFQVARNSWLFRMNHSAFLEIREPDAVWRQNPTL